MPEQDVEALAAADSAAQSAPAQGTDPAIRACPGRAALHVIEVMVVGEDDAPLADVAVTLAHGGRMLRGSTAADGVARFEGLSEDGIDICLHALDVAAWTFIEAQPLASERLGSGQAAVWQTAPVVESAEGIDHVVQAGEGIDVLAVRHGLFPAVVWDHERNAALRAQRDSGNVLRPGDRLYLPGLRRKTQAATPDCRHLIRRNGVPSRLRLRLYDDLRALGGVPWRLETEGCRTVEGVTGRDGMLDTWLPASVRRATLTFGATARRVELRIGALAPLDPVPSPSSEGLRQRLANLGFVSDPGKADEAAIAGALARLQEAWGLPVTGQCDATTRERLFAWHDGVSTPAAPDLGMFAPPAT